MASRKGTCKHTSWIIDSSLSVICDGSINNYIFTKCGRSNGNASKETKREAYSKETRRIEACTEKVWVINYTFTREIILFLKFTKQRAGSAPCFRVFK